MCVVGFCAGITRLSSRLDMLLGCQRVCQHPAWPRDAPPFVRTWQARKCTRCVWRPEKTLPPKLRLRGDQLEAGLGKQRDCRSPSLFQLCSGECRARGHVATGHLPLSTAGRAPSLLPCKQAYLPMFSSDPRAPGSALRAPLGAGPFSGPPQGHAPLAIFSAGWSGAVALCRVVRRTRHERSRLCV